jgi:3-hydroxyacyl-[acyl-carrier-protein] dehydratase
MGITEMASNNVLPNPIEAQQIMDHLSHRYPFLMLDRIISMQREPDKRLQAIKNVTINEPFFAGHFPGNPVMPGVLIVEAMAQACGMLAFLDAQLDGTKGELYYLVKVDNARFSRVVVPGDQLLLDVEQKRIVRSMGQYICQATVNGVKVASCELLCAAKSS